MKDMLRRANAFVKENARAVNPLYRPAFHSAPPVGWINDPNGFGVYGGIYHLFCQYHPYAPVWGPMHWGHWTSGDLVDWTWHSVALAPDRPYDDMGCFSGTSIDDGGRMILMYTGVHRDADGTPIQEQCIAESRDGMHFTKWAINPVLGKNDLPEGFAREDFRDPKLMKTEAGYRVIVAGRSREGGCQLLYTSRDLKTWRYEGIFLSGISDMPECPDAFSLDGNDIMITSAMNLPPDGLRFQNGHHDTVCLIGQERSGRLHAESMEAVDLGPDFYAPQSLRTADGRSVLVAWMQMWGEDSPTRYLGHGWNGLNTIAREMSVREGRLYQRPVRELAAYRGAKTQAQNVRVAGAATIAGIGGRQYEMELALTLAPEGQAEIRLLQTGDECFRVHYDARTRILTTDRSQCGHTMGQDGLLEVKPFGRARVLGDPLHLTLRILVDTCSVEVFACGGAVVLTTLAFPRHAAQGISFAGDFTIDSLAFWPIRKPPARSAENG